MNPAGIILSAGLAKRFGTTKALAIFHTRPLIEIWVRLFHGVKLSKVIVVVNNLTGPEIKMLLAKTKLPVEYVVQTEPEGPAFSSMQMGLKVAGTAGAFITPVDVLPPAEITMRQFLGALENETFKKVLAVRPRDITQKLRGHPVYVSPELTRRLITLPPLTTRLDEVLQRLGSKVLDLDVDDPRICTNINSAKDLSDAEQRFPYRE